MPDDKNVEKFTHLDIYQIEIFGYDANYKKDKQWLFQLNKVKKFSLLNKKEFIPLFKKDIALSYERLATFKLKDLDNDFIYTIYFDNMLKKWNIILDDSTEVDSVDIHDKIDLMKYELIKKLISRSYEIFNMAQKLIKDHILMYVENGELLDIDEVKLEAILAMLNDQELIGNFRKRVYIK